MGILKTIKMCPKGEIIDSSEIDTEKEKKRAKRKATQKKQRRNSEASQES